MVRTILSPFTPSECMFVVHAKGNSMFPRIKDGDLCVFERYEGGVEVHSKIELQPLNTKDFKTIEIPKDAETQYATIGVLKFIIGQ